ncbi:MAG: tetratricopeptide repeat protein, partial [Chloroflexi bacterium]|nr:tetratricopeptide repeat protein [Chloroflexota bacterium]
EALGNMGRAMDYYVEADDVARAVAIAELPLPPDTGLTGATDLIARALELLPADSHEAARLLVRYGLELQHERGDYEGAREALGRSLDIARREGDTSLEVRALANAADVEAFQLQWPESMENCLAAIELGGRADEPHAEVRAQFWASMIAMCLVGDLEMARSHAEASLPPAERLRNGYSLPRALWGNETALRLEGRWEEALEISDRALALTPRGPLLLASRSIMECELGNLDKGQHFLQRLVEAVGDTSPGPTFEYGATAVAIPATGRILGSTERFDMVESIADTILSSPSVTPIFSMLATIGQAIMAVERGDEEQAAGHYATLKAAQGTMLLGGIAGDRLLGLLAMTDGRLDEAAAHFEGALELCTRAGFHPEHAWTACDYAETLLRRKGPGDDERAAALLDESLKIAEELGMRPLMERASRQREAAGIG